MKVSRRKLFQNSLGAAALAGASPLAPKGLAADVGGVNLINIFLKGAPVRCFWDLPLATHPDEVAKLPLNKIWGTRYDTSGGEYKGQIYQLTEIGPSGNKTWLPHLWSLSMPDSGGGTVSMANLVNNLMIIRGINSFFGDHIAGVANHFNPRGADRGLLELQGDFSRNLIPSLKMGDGGGTSPVGRPCLEGDVDVDDPIAKIAGAGHDYSFAENPEKQSAVVEFLNRSSQYSGQGHSTLDYINTMQNELANRTFGDTTATWDAVSAKYLALTQAALSTVLPGISDQKIAFDSASKRNYYLDGRSSEMADYRNVILGTDAHMNDLAKKFALAEYAITSGLTGSVCISPDTIADVQQGSNIISNARDEHATGSMMSLLMNAYESFSLATCINELVSTLKTLNLFNNTVISISSEFGRGLHDDGRFSSHNQLGKSLTLFSGLIDGPYVLGDISAKGAGESSITFREEANTIAKILNVPAPFDSRYTSIVDRKDGKIVPKAGMGPGKQIG